MFSTERGLQSRFSAKMLSGSDKIVNTAAASTLTSIAAARLAVASCSSSGVFKGSYQQLLHSFVTTKIREQILRCIKTPSIEGLQDGCMRFPC